MKKFLIAVFLVVLALGLGGVWFYQNTRPVETTRTDKSFLIVKGTSASQIGANLEKAGLIRSALVFKLYLKFTGAPKKILAGDYNLSPGFSLFELLRQLLKGPKEIWVTIPEGLRREEVARKFAVALGKDETFVQDFLKLTQNKEGFLFPETYLFPKEAEAGKIIEKMLSTFDFKVGVSVTREEVILASLVERETRTAAERPVVAGILKKRLQIGMPLQVDATIQYLKGNWQPIILEDRKIKSLYNTYLNEGLPPGPICNPGLASIQAVQNPTQTDYWYYLHDTKGVIHYARSLEEQNLNIQQYLD